MLLLDCNSEVRLGPLLSHRLKSFQMSVFSEAFVRVKWTDHWALPVKPLPSWKVENQEGVGLDKGKRAAGTVLFPQVDSLKHLLETGDSVNAPPNPFEQSPVHLAAGGGCACLLLWQLQTGADLNQQVTR